MRVRFFPVDDECSDKREFLLAQIGVLRDARHFSMLGIP